MIKVIAFDLGGVVITIDRPQAIRRFRELGLADAESRLDAYTQTGIFGDLEAGKIGEEEFRIALERLTGRRLTISDCRYAWQGYRKEVPERNLELLRRLRQEGYRVVLASNTNPCMMEWADRDFDGKGHAMADYFDAMYRSYEIKEMKPGEGFFRFMLNKEAVAPADMLFVDDGPRNCEAAGKLGIRTFCPVNGQDWTQRLPDFL